MVVSAALISGVAAAQPPPAEAQPGQCFGRVQLPDTVDVEHVRVRVRGSSLVRRVWPAQTRTVTSRVLATPARTSRTQAPARYRLVAHVETTAGAARFLSIPARYRLERTRIEVAPSRLVWVRRSGAPQYAAVLPGQTALTPTGEVLCRVRTPARYAMRTRRVLIGAARRIQIQGRPVHRRVVERVLVAPARTLVESHPAIYRTVHQQVIVRPARSTWISTRPQWRDVVRERRSARSGWAQVVCPGGLAPWAMQRLQSGLTADGYDPGPSDGRARPQTYEALHRFQTDHRLAEGQITVESARILGVVP